MLSADLSRATLSDQIFCCATKQYYNQPHTIAETLEIHPRIILYKKKLRTHQIYEQCITIKNIGLYPRSIKIYNDNISDMKIEISREPFQYIQPDETIYMKMKLEPKQKLDINRTRNIYIECEHPNIIFEIPIIVLEKKEFLRHPPSIVFPRSVPGSIASFEFIIYNPTSYDIAIKSRTANNKLRIYHKYVVPKKDYICILLRLSIIDLKSVSNILKVKVGKKNKYIDIPLHHEPIPSTLYLSHSHLEFEELKFEREVKSSFHVCNESELPINYTVKFLTTNDELQQIKLEMPYEVTDNPNSCAIPLSSTGSYASLNEEYKNDIVSKKNQKVYTEFHLSAHENFSINRSEGEISPNSSSKFIVTFHPIFNDEILFDDDIDPPYLQRTKIFFTVTDELYTEVKSLVVVGFIKGPEIQISPQNVELPDIYVGETYCEQIKMANMDCSVNAEVRLKTFDQTRIASVHLKPKNGLILEPCSDSLFHLSFFTRIVGKFLIKLVFKVKNGLHYNVLVSGISKSVRVRMHPEVVEFGSIPFGVPQKRFVLIGNPLFVPLTVQCKITDDGSDIPLVLNIHQTDKFQPITIYNPQKILERCLYDEEHWDFDEEMRNAVDPFTPAKSNASLKSHYTDESEFSTEFEDEILEPITEFATTVISNLKKKTIIDRLEPEKKIVDEALNLFLSTNYFNKMNEHTNYAEMDWNSIPSDPKEVYWDNEVIYLHPNASKSITILLIPNTVGYFHRYMEIRACPIQNEHSKSCMCDSTYDIVDSEVMTTKLYLEYNCRVPRLNWNDKIEFEEKVYAGQLVPFEMVFMNETSIAGFLFYEVLPLCDEGEMIFEYDEWKFYIRPDDVLRVPCYVLFKGLGKTKLSGLLKVVGQALSMPFHIYADVLPTRVTVTPSSVYRRQGVLEHTKFYIYIDNATPTKTWVKFILKCTKYQYIEPKGAMLGPGQGTYITLHTQYFDPEFYKNILVVKMTYGDDIEIPITFNIERMPIFFDPVIVDVIDAGDIPLNSRDNFYSDIPNYKKVINVINRGDRSYRLTIKKNKSGPAKCDAKPVTGRINIEPNTILLSPGSESFITVTANGYTKVSIYNEFLIQIVDQENKKRMETKRIMVKANFVEPEVVWSRSHVYMEYHRSHKFKEHSIIEVVHLTNLANIEIENVHLKVVGPFKLKALFEHRFTKEASFPMKAMECKEITVLLCKKEIKKENCNKVEGRVICKANEKIQRSLFLKVLVLSPELVINKPQLVLFTTDVQRDTTIEISNLSCLEAEYKWKKISEDIKYISEVDDAYELSERLLSEIFRMLDIQDEDDASLDPIVADNLTLRYQHYRCKLHKLEDPIDVRDIIDDVIDKLDLEHKRYVMKLDEAVGKHTALHALRQDSASTCVGQTIDMVLDMLKLEDSYEVSQESSQDCAEERSIYFYEKSAVLQSGEKMQCALHLPAVKKDYEHTATFELDVVGGTPKEFQIILVNLSKTIELSKDSVYLGIKPWYELYKSTVRIKNVTEYPISIELNEERPTKKRQHISHGYVKIKSDESFDIPKLEGQLIKTEGIMGFSEEFIRDIKIVVNESEEKYLRLRGQGIMPILSVTSKMARPQQEAEEIIDEYKLLQNVYYFNVFRGIIEEEDIEIREGIEEAHLETQSLAESFSSLGSTSTTSSRTYERRFFNLMKTYVLVNNNEELPNALVLEQLLQTTKFLAHLNKSPNDCLLLQKVYQDYVKMVKTHDAARPINLKHFTAQPLPWQLYGYVLNMHQLKLNKSHSFEIDIHFFGPGKLIAAVRTTIKIPGLLIDFEVDENEDRDFVFYVEEEISPDSHNKPYRNMFERMMDMENDSKLKHAHSFDFDERSLHNREISALERKEIMNYYSSLNKSVYADHKHHYILCKIFSNSKKNYSDTNIHLTVTIKPRSKFYEDGQLIEDYIYVDLHLGPTLPILLRGIVSKD